VSVCAKLVLLFWGLRANVVLGIAHQDPVPHTHEICMHLCLPQVLEKVTEKPACLPAPTALEEDADARAYWLLHDVWEA
jgi:hypothetical protein